MSPPTVTKPINSKSAPANNPEALVDTIDTFHKQQDGNDNDNGTTNTTGSGNGNGSGNGTDSSSFDPIEFLNYHYKTESSLITALPTLRSTLNTRMTTLSDSISSTIQKQSDMASLTMNDVTRAKNAVAILHQRVTTVQSKARQSEEAVQEITRDMKRLDYAKKHLSVTITTLKRLHMLIHATAQLRHAVRVCDPPDYKNAGNLVDATQFLLSHFRGYMTNVEKMRLLQRDVEEMRVELNEGIMFGFRVVGFGLQGALEKKEKEDQKKRKKSSKSSSSSSSPGKADKKTKEQQEREETQLKKASAPLPPETLNSACSVLDALGPEKRAGFVKTFCSDHLEPYQQLFHPHNNKSAGGVAASTAAAATAQKPSFKIMLSDSKDDKENTALSNPNQASLDQMERRYAWYRRMLRELDEIFPSVFPKHWNMEYRMTHAFLIETGRHILLLFSGAGAGAGASPTDIGSGSARDRDCGNVSVLLKALQKTILFEKEMTAWLQREYGTVFIDTTAKKEDDQDQDQVLGDDGEALEFDESGRAVAASSAEGIRIKYERKMNDRKKREAGGGNGNGAGRSGNGGTTVEDENGNVDWDKFNRGNIDTKVPVPPLMSVASISFEKFMGPYIALEEQNMDEQLRDSASDRTVDTRGELPVFTSSTALFLYIKNSITRCTALTNRKTLLSLYRAFQRTLRKYAKVLEGKYPSALSGPAAAIGGMNISIAGLSAGNASAIKDVYRIPQGEEVTICHVIDTCEYCTDTVEALQDLIIDKIEDRYKEKINMSGEEEAFTDVTAKGIRVLVSGLVQRTDQAFKGMYNITWSSIDVVGEESAYVRSMHGAIQPFVVKIKAILPSSYFRNFCDQFAMLFTNAFYNTIVRQKRISESGTQQLLLDVYNLKTLLLKVPVLEASSNNNNNSSPQKVGSTSTSTIAPAMYTKTVTKQFQRIEILLKLVGTPADLLIDVFRVQWPDGSAFDLQSVMNLKGMKRNEQAAMLERIGVDPITAMKGAAAGASGVSMTENIQSFQGKSSDVAAKVNSDLVQMRQKVEDFRKAFR